MKKMRGKAFIKSTTRASNPQPSVWKTDALPIELVAQETVSSVEVPRQGVEPRTYRLRGGCSAG